MENAVHKKTAYVHQEQEKYPHLISIGSKNFRNTTSHASQMCDLAERTINISSYEFPAHHADISGYEFLAHNQHFRL